MKKLYLFMTMLFASALSFVTQAETTVYFDNSNANWSNVKLYHSGSENWPGGDMTSVGNNIWKATVPDNASLIIFNNGNSGNGNQTDDIKNIIKNAVYDKDCKAVSYEISYDNDGTNWASATMSPDGSAFSVTLKIEKTKEFGIKKYVYSNTTRTSDPTDTWISANNSSVYWITEDLLGQECPAKVNGNNWYVDFDGEATYKFDPINYKLTVTKVGGDTPTTLPTEFYIWGNFDGNNWSNGIKLDKTSDGIFKKTVKFIHDGTNTQSWFRFYSLSSSDTKIYWANSSNNKEVVVGTSVDIQNNGTTENNYIFKGDVSSSYDVEVNLNTGKLTITPSVGTDLKFKSNISGGWDDGVAMTAGANNIWTYNVTNATASTQFVIKAGGKEYKPNALTTIALNQEYKVYSGKDETCNFKFPVAGNYVVTVNAADINNMTVTVTRASFPTQLDLYDGNGKIINSTSYNTDNKGKYVWVLSELAAGTKVQLRNTGNTGDTNDRYAYKGNVSLNRWVTLTNGDVYTSIPRKLTDVTITANLDNNTFKIEGTREVKPMPEGEFVYFNAGADYYSTMAEQPIYASFIKKGDVNPEKDDKGQNIKTEMLDIRDYDADAVLPLFFAKIPDNPENYSGVEFSVTNGETTYYYNSRKYRVTDTNDTDKNNYDETNWWKYIYGCGHSADATYRNICSADQSFITYEDYKAVRDGEKTAVYFAGNNIEFVNGTNTTEINWDGTLGESDKNDDVYFANFKIKDGTSNETKFKMTWINVNGRLNDYNATNGKNVGKGSQRWWATFNVGIVGPTLPPGTTLETAPETVVQKDIASNSNNAVAFVIPRCREYSRLNQWDWWIPSTQIENHGTEYTLIIDTDYHTAALLDFKPQPTIAVDEIDGTATNVIDGVNGTLFTDAQQIEFGNKLLGSSPDCTAKIDKVNDISGTATVFVSNKKFLADSYELSYLIYSGDELIAEFEGVPDAHHYDLTFKHLAYGTNRKISCRAFYHDLKNDTHFRSLYEETQLTINNKPEFKLPSVDETHANNVTNQLIFKDKDGWHAQVNVEFDIIPATVSKPGENGSTEFVPLSVYPDFSINNVNNGKPGYTQISLAKAGDFQVDNKLASAHDTGNNWVDAAIENANGTYHQYLLRLVFRNIIDNADTTWDDVRKSSYNVDYNIIAQYPFYIDYNNDCEVTAYSDEEGKKVIPTPVKVRRKVDGVAEGRATGQTVVMSSVKAPTTTTVSGGSLSGIIDAEMFGGDGEVELYNLQGIRVVGEPAPGIYLRRCGNTVTKVIVK